MGRIVSETSINAYRAHTQGGLAHGQRMRILAHIRARGGDWSIGELAAALEMDKCSVSARVHELMHDTDALIARPRRKDRVSGILVRPVALAMAGEAAQDARTSVQEA